MRPGRILRYFLILSIWTVPARAQETQIASDTSPRFFLDSDVGIRAELGFLPPSSDFGASLEIPLLRRIEIQGSASFSPDKKKITDDGHSISAYGTGILWINPRVGALGGVEYGQLWTSQFDEGGYAPFLGAAIRTHYEYPGRLYIRYSIPTGCVWATPSNPCKLQSKRLQGPTFRQEFQLVSHIRAGVEAGIYHFCDQSNEDDPAVPRTCHWAGTELIFIRFQFPAWRRSGGY